MNVLELKEETRNEAGKKKHRGNVKARFKDSKIRKVKIAWQF